MKITIPSRLSDADLVAEVSRCARDERGSTAHLVAHLAEFDARRLHLGAGFSSLFAYCCKVLRLSEHGTYNRIEAARAARLFPEILDRLAQGSLNLTTVRLLAPHLREDNHEELLTAALRRSKREVEELVARLFPRPEKRALVSPLATDRYEIRFTASAATREKPKVVQDLLRHAVPNGDPAEIFDRALTALHDQLARQKLAVVRKAHPKGRPTAPGSRHVPSTVKRAVWKRDGGQCAFVGAGGHHCSERGFLEYHHLTPYGVGGEATFANIQLRCRAHNGYESELFYGANRVRGGADVVRESPPNHLFPGVSNSFRGELGAWP